VAEAPAPTELLYATDAYRRSFASVVVAVDEDRHAVVVAETAFFPSGGGQPHDTGRLASADGAATVRAVVKDAGGVVWHMLAAEDPLIRAGTDVEGFVDWNRRHLLMRTHTALHILNGLIWRDHRARVTGAHMTPGEGRLDFELPAMSQDFGRHIEGSVNVQVERDLAVQVLFLPRAEADRDPSLIRLKANLIPHTIDPLRVIDIVGLDRQADGGTHVASTREVGRVRVTKVQSKGRANKRIRIALADGGDAHQAANDVIA
jgi:misacylated tRNA(Ala) deacylase